MLKIAVCDDVKIDKDHLVSIIEQIMSKKHLKYCVNQFSSGEEFLKDKMTYDIIFMDIEMSDMSGMEVAKKLYEAGSQAFLIFTTSYDDYLREGYKVRAFRYIMKPVPFNEVEEAVNQIIKIWYADRILFKRNDTWYAIAQKDILYVESANGGRGVMIHTKKNKLFDSRTMEEYGQLLSENRFFRSHRCCYVNMDYIESYDRSNIFLKSGEQVWLSCKKHKVFTEAFHSYKWERGSR